MIRLLGSRRLATDLFVAYGVFLALLFTWGVTIPHEVLQAISRLSPFWLLYALAGLHLLACLILFWPIARRRISLAAPPQTGGVGVRLLPDEVAPTCARVGLRLQWLADQRVAVLYRHRFASLGSLLFHAALLLLPVAFAVSQLTYFRGDGLIIEGHEFDGGRASYSQIDPPDAFASRAPELRLAVKGIEAAFWGEQLFFTDLRALVTAHDGDQQRSAWITVEDPLRIAGARVTIRGFNYTPALELTGPAGRTLFAGDLNLRLFPPPLEDSFRLPELPHRFWVRLLPNAERDGDAPRNRGFALERPLFHVAVTRGKRLVSHAWLRPGEPLEFDGHQLRFTAIRRGGDLLVVRDLGYPILWLALLLALLGTAARILFPTLRIWIFWSEGGARAVVREDPFAGGRGAALVESWRADGD